MRREWHMHLIGVIGMVVFLFWMAVTLLLCFPVQVLALPFDPLRKAGAAVARWTWGTCLFRTEPFWRLVRTGFERTTTGPFVIVANHQSLLDIPLLLQLPVPFKAVGRAGVLDMPLYGRMARLGGHVMLDPLNPEPAMAACAVWMDRGMSIVVFPEGHRSPDCKLQAFQRGAFELALRTGRPILPVAITGTGVALPKGRFYGKEPLTHVHLQVLPPVAAEGTRRSLSRRVHGDIAAALDGLHPHHLADAVGARYRPAGRFRSGFAWGKVTFDPLFWMLHERLPLEGELVDLGCGEGLLGAYVAAGGSRVRYRGYDVDADRVAAGVRAGLDCAVADLTSMTIPEADAIVCADVLHYFEPSVQDEIVARMATALRPGGRLYIRDPEPARGLASWWTAFTERIFVATGRHVGGTVRVRGSAVLAEVLRRDLIDVRCEDASFGTPFANVLVSGARPRLG